jgi:peptidoglycan hydrolase-like amidase
MNIKVKMTTNENIKFYNCPKGTIKEVDFEDYVAIVVASEMGNAPAEALKA